MKLDEFEHSSDFVFKAIPFIYPTGYAVVMNCWMSTWDKTNDFKVWMEERLKRLPEDHPLREKMMWLEFGYCLIFHSDVEEEAWTVYNTFDDPDRYYVTFWENGKITNENT